jgi:hypothetical protein
LTPHLTPEEPTTTNGNPLYPTKAQRLKLLHRQWLRPVAIATIATVLGGIVLLGVRLNDHKSVPSTTPAVLLERFGILQARDVTQGWPFSYDQVPVRGQLWQ